MANAIQDPVCAPISSAKLLETATEAMERLLRAEEAFDQVLSLETGRALQDAHLHAKNTVAYLRSLPKPTFMAERHEESHKAAPFPARLLRSLRTYIHHLRLDNAGKITPEELTNGLNLEDHIDATLRAAGESVR